MRGYSVSYVCTSGMPSDNSLHVDYHVRRLFSFLLLVVWLWQLIVGNDASGPDFVLT